MYTKHLAIPPDFNILNADLLVLNLIQHNENKNSRLTKDNALLGCFQVIDRKCSNIVGALRRIRKKNAGI